MLGVRLCLTQDLGDCDLLEEHYQKLPGVSQAEKDFFRDIINRLSDGTDINTLLDSASEVKPGVSEHQEITAVRNIMTRKDHIGADSNQKPAHQIKKLKFSCDKESAEWLEQARIAAIIGASPSSKPGILTSLRCYVAFCVATRVRDTALPPRSDIVLAWSTQFRNHRTFKNYIGYLRTACNILNCSDAGLDRNLLRRATTAIEKRMLWQPRPKLFVRAAMLPELMRRASILHSEKMSMLYLATYTFLLRMPSESIPMSYIKNREHFKSQRSAVTLDDGIVHLQLSRRKNMPRGSEMQRKCICKSPQCRSEICPVHVLGKWLIEHQSGAQLFSSISPSMATNVLRQCLSEMGIDRASEFRLHDFRRGHAQDLLESGATLAEILRAGQWRSPAFMTYLDQKFLETEAVVSAHVENSSDEENDINISETPKAAKSASHSCLHDSDEDLEIVAVREPMLDERERVRQKLNRLAEQVRNLHHSHVDHDLRQSASSRQ